MKRFVLLMVIFLSIQCVCVNAESFFGSSWDYIAAVDNRLYFSLDGYLYSSDMDMKNIDVLQNAWHATSLCTDGENLYYVSKGITYDSSKQNIFRYDTVNKKYYEFDTGCEWVDEILIRNEKIYFWGDQYIWEYDTNSNEKRQIVYMKKEIMEPCLLGMVDQYIYYVESYYPDGYTVYRMNLDDGAIISDFYDFIDICMHGDNIYLYNADENGEIVILDKNLDVARRVKYDWSEIKQEKDSRYSMVMNLLVDGKYLYDCKIRINLETGETDYWDFAFKVRDTVWYADMTNGKAYIMERTGVEIFVIDTESNNVSNVDCYEVMAAARRKNTLLWNLLKQRYPDVSETDYEIAKSVYPDNLYKMLNYIESEVLSKSTSFN